MSTLLYGGLEGGGSHCVVVIMNGDGQILSEIEVHECVSCTLVGMEECQRRINKFVREAKIKAEIDPEIPLTSLGLSMSGCEQAEICHQLETELADKYPTLSETFCVTSDTVGSVLTASPNGGVVLISGTGSNSLVINSDGSVGRCGGWGYLLGDEGSAYWIALRAMKLVIDDEENFAPSPHNTQIVKSLLWEHFELNDILGLIDHAYTNFNKSSFANFCKKMATEAPTDPLVQHVFTEGGRVLGRHVAALVPKMNKTLFEIPGGLHIVCVGSVWKSWSLLKTGFIEGCQSRRETIKEFTLVKLKSTLAIGAAYLGAKTAGHNLQFDYSANAETFYHWKYTESHEKKHGVNGVNGNVTSSNEVKNGKV